MSLTPEDLHKIKEVVDASISAKLEPIKNDLASIKTDLSAVRTHTHSINERLYKL